MTNNILCFIVILNVMTNNKFRILNTVHLTSWCSCQLDSVSKRYNRHLTTSFSRFVLQITAPYLAQFSNSIYEVEEMQFVIYSTALEYDL